MEPNVSRSQLREILLIVGPAVLLVAGAFWLAFQFVEPAPPKVVKLSAGNAAGAYYAFALRYKEILARSGITLEVTESAGSVENLSRLNDHASGFKLALMQGGIADQKRAPGILSLGRVFVEPVWVFYRGEPIERLAMLAGKRIAIGVPGSGTRVLAETLLKQNNIDEANATFVPKGGKVAADALIAGEVDAVFLALAAQSPLVDKLIRADGVRLLSFTQAEAYSRLLPYLLPVTLPAGVISLVGNLPPQDVTLLAAKAALVAREDTHPAILELMAAAAKEVHGGGGMFQRAEEFPKSHDPEFPVAEEAKRYYDRGPGILQRYLPFWLANFVERTFVMIVPIATILIPLVKIVPWLYDWRIRQRILYWYGQLKGVEQKLAAAAGKPVGSALVDDIHRIEDAVSTIPVPLHYSDKLFELRGAVDMVRQRVLARA